MEVYTGLLAVVELHYHQFTPFSISPNFFAQTAVFLKKNNFCFMKTANILYGNIAVPV